MPLHEFLSANLPRILAIARKKFLEGQDRAAIADDDETRLALFLRQLIETLRTGAANSVSTNPEIRESAAKHGADLLKQGFTVAQVVHGYGSVCQAVTDLAVDLGAAFTASEFRTLNQCLDAATAEAVTEYSRQRDEGISDQSTLHLGVFAHELRNLLTGAMLSFDILQKGQVGIAGNTGGVLRRSLLGLRDLIDRTLSKVRLAADIQQQELVRVAELVEEIEASATIEAKARGIHVSVVPGKYDVFVDVDRQLVASALSNLMQNGIKFSPRGATVRMGVRVVSDRVLIDVTDQCGGLLAEDPEEMFRPFAQGHADRRGLGLGLAIARQSVEANRGRLQVRNLRGEGCVFTMDLPMGKTPPPGPHGQAIA